MGILQGEHQIPATCKSFKPRFPILADSPGEQKGRPPSRGTLGILFEPIVQLGGLVSPG